MRLTITTAGSRGDLQPSLALGHKLRERGHNVRIATHLEYERAVLSCGLEFAPVFGDPVGDMRRLTGTGRGRNIVSFASQNRRNLDNAMAQMVSNYRDACRDADAVLYDYAGFAGYFVARALGLPSAGAFAEPLAEPTTQFRSPLMPEAPSVIGKGSVHAAYNRLSHLIAARLFWQFLRQPVNRSLRSVLDMDPIPFRSVLEQIENGAEPAVFGFSPSVLGNPPDWPDSRRVTGFWFLDDDPDWSPSQELSEFLSSGTPPLFITLGSVVEEDPAAMTRLLLQALEISGQRAILQTGWSGLGRMPLPEHVLRIGEVPYNWLFPRVQAVVQHGGAGTIAEALRAGVPSVVIPSFHSQPFWASTLAQLGAAPEPIPRSELSAARLASAMQTVASDNRFTEVAEELSGHIANEHGVLKAAQTLEDRIRG